MKHKFPSRVIESTITSFIIIFMILTQGLTIASANLSVEPISTIYPEWNLVVTGYVENPLNLSWSDIAALPQTTVNADLICVDWPDQVLMSGNWTGVKLKLLLETAGISLQAMKVGFFATDNFSTDLTLETAMSEDVSLLMNLMEYLLVKR